MADRITSPTGTHDVLPRDASARLGVEKLARSVLESAGYRRIETPAFEATELFARGVGASTDIVQKEMYTFEDGGGRSMTLRPEGTAPVARAYMEHGMHKLPQPVKLWYLSSFFRYERAQAGRYRQFWQVGAEAIGSAEPAVDAESIVLLHTILGELGIQDMHLRLGSLGTPETRAVYREKLVAHLRANEDRLGEDVRSRIDLNPLRAFDSDHPGTKEVMKTAPLLMEELAPDDAEHFDEVRAMLDVAGVPYDLDPTLVRGLDYYARTVFEFTSGALGAQSAVGGGGRYDGLIEQLGGPPTPGIGWAAGIERMLLSAGHMPAPEPGLDVYVAIDAGDDPTAARTARVEGFHLVARARAAGLSAQIELAGRSLKGQLKQAARGGARYVAVVRPEEIALKDMETGDQQPVPGGVDAVIHDVLRGRGPAAL